MSSEERDIVLQMLSEGKISPSEAGELLDALDVKEAAPEEPRVARPEPAIKEGRSKADSRSLMIEVRDGGETRTHVQIPLGLAMAAGKFLPKKTQDYLEQFGIEMDELLENVTEDLARKGPIVDVRDGDTMVQIAVI